jgi:hypothetical protein
VNRFAIVALAGFFAFGLLNGCASSHGHEDKEVTVALKDVPAPVRATLERESAGGKVTEVEKEVKDGKTVYSADMVVAGVAWDITVAENGTVVSKEKEKDGEE